MKTKTFKIEYKDPETGEDKVITEEFSDSPDVESKFWAEDYAYSLADKGGYKITELDKPLTETKELSSKIENNISGYRLHLTKKEDR